tara:strand:- start:4754 stop:5038 length:285 start_codon:yes stop_codon:yes gene_type:complete
MANKIYIEGQGVVNMDADESAALDARRAPDAAWRTEELRTERNRLLAETDWVITMHKEKGTNIPSAWKTYRQSLRDITKDYKSLNDVKWPEKPE